MPGIFDGVVIVDFTSNVAGPTATAMMADYGASVIKIEKPGMGDDNRWYGPFIDGKGVLAPYYNRNKKSITLDTRKPEAMEVVKKLIAQADVVVESFRPGAIKKMGLGYEELVKIKPDIIMLSVSGFGQDGPMGQKAGYDMLAVAMSGIMDNTGFPDGPPTKIGSAIGDAIGGLDAFGALAAALYHKLKTGEGQYIDISLLEGIVNINDYTDVAYNRMEVPLRSGNHHAVIAPFGLFSGKDGAIILTVASDKLWATLCNLMGRPELGSEPKYQGSGKRAMYREEIVTLIEAWLHTFDHVTDALALLDEAGIPCCKVYKTQELPDNEQLLARDMIVDIRTSEFPGGVRKTRAPVLHFSKTPGRVEFAPALGEHTEEILQTYLQLDEAGIDALRATGALG